MFFKPDYMYLGTENILWDPSIIISGLWSQKIFPVWFFNLCFRNQSSQELLSLEEKTKQNIVE